MGGPWVRVIKGRYAQRTIEAVLSDKKLPVTRLIIFAGAIAALDIILSALPLFPYGPSAAVFLKPSEGILLGALGGPLAAFVGGLVSNLIWPSTAALGLATWIPGVVGAFGAGMLMKRRWIIVAVAMLLILVGFLVHPFGSIMYGGFPLFVYANWDKTIALLLVYPVYRFSNHRLCERNVRALMPAIGLIALIATEMDGATGNLIFLIEAGPIFGLSAQMLPPLFIPFTFVDAATRILVGIICAVVLTPVLVAVDRANLLKWPLT